MPVWCYSNWRHSTLDSPELGPRFTGMRSSDTPLSTVSACRFGVYSNYAGTQENNIFFLKSYTILGCMILDKVTFTVCILTTCVCGIVEQKCRALLIDGVYNTPYSFSAILSISWYVQKTWTALPPPHTHTHTHTHVMLQQLTYRLLRYTLIL